MEHRKSFCQVREEGVTGTSYALRELPVSMRPREAADRYGIENVPNETLLAIILRTGAPGMNVVGMAEELIRRYGSLDALAAASVLELERNGIRGMGHVKSQILAAAFELGRRSVLDTAQRPLMRTPSDLKRLLMPLADGLEQEHFWVILLDVRCCMIGQIVEVSRGVLDASLVSPREAFKEAIRSAAKCIVIAHNHPTGDSSPSAEDLRVTRQLIEAGKVIGIPVMDHLIVGSRPSGGRQQCLSLREEKLVTFG